MVSDLARLVSARSLAEPEWMPAVETRAFVSSTIFCLLVTALPWRASDSLPTQAAAKTLEQAWVVQLVPIHSRRAAGPGLYSTQLLGLDRPGLPGASAAVARDGARWHRGPLALIN